MDQDDIVSSEDEGAELPNDNRQHSNSHKRKTNDKDYHDNEGDQCRNEHETNIHIDVEIDNDNESNNTENNNNEVEDETYYDDSATNIQIRINDKKYRTDINENSCDLAASGVDDLHENGDRSYGRETLHATERNIEISNTVQNGKKVGYNNGDESVESDEEEILKNTKFVDEIVSRRPSRSRRSGVVNDYKFVECLLSSSSNNSDGDVSPCDTNSSEVNGETKPPDNTNTILDNKDHSPDNLDYSPDNIDYSPDNIDYSPDNIDYSPDNKHNVRDSKEQTPDNTPNNHNESCEEQTPNKAKFFIGSALSYRSESDIDASPSPTDNSDIYYEEPPKRLKRSGLRNEDFSGAKTYQDKNKLIVKYPNRRVSFEHPIQNSPEQKISPLALEVSPSASPRTILKNPKKRASFESHMYRHIVPTGHINYGYMHDEMTDKLQKRKVSMETAAYYEQESQWYNGSEYNNDDEEDCESPKINTENGKFIKNEFKKSNGERFQRIPENGVQNGFCKRVNSNDDFTSDDKVYFTKRPSLMFDGEEFDLVNKNFASHLRKDSIALTSEKLQHLQSIQRHYNPTTYAEESIWKQKISNWRKYQLHICVVSIFLALVSVVVVGWHFHHRTNKIERIGKRIFFDAETREIYLPNPSDTNRLTGTIGLNVPNWQLPFHCHTESEKSIYTCLRWKDNAVLRISYFEKENVKCYNISWQQLRHDLIPYDCYDIGADHWYGPGNHSSASWPLTSEPFTFSASMSRHFDAGTFSSATDYHWLSSGGSAIFVPNDVPLEISWNKKPGKICLIAKYTGDFYGGHTLDKAQLNYTVCSGKDAVTTYKYTRTLMEKLPNNMPTTSILQKPVWSFRVDRQMLDGDQRAVEVLQRIESENLQCSVFEIAGQWQRRFGDLVFNNKTFTNVSTVAELAANNNCGLSVEINPYFDVHSSNFKHGSKHKYFIQDSGAFAPGIVKWNHEINAMLDVSRSAASSWMAKMLQKLKDENGIQSFSVVYAKPFWVPYNPSFSADRVNPSTLREMFSDMFSAVTSTLFSDIIQGTSNSQNIPYFLPVPSHIDKKESALNCLSGSIERSLTLGIKGYPFLISDLIPIDTIEGTTLPSKELYVRWLQLSAFLPAMRFSIMPWEYDANVVDTAKNLTHMHKSIITPTILSLEDEIMAGYPIIRPIWWVHPGDIEAFKVADEFLVGDNLLVAPVLCENVQERKIYFPEGMWSDKSNGNLIQGKNWITYPVNENKIPHFFRVKVLTTSNSH